MNLYKFDKAFLEQKSKETGFVRDNLEKVYRLTDILIYINTLNIGGLSPQYLKN